MMSKSDKFVFVCLVIMIVWSFMGVIELTRTVAELERKVNQIEVNI